MFCKMSMFLLSSLSNMAIDSENRWVGGRWPVVSGRWSVGRWFVGLIKIRKNMFGLVISPVHFGRGLFCCSNFNVFYIDDKNETNLIGRSSPSNL